MDAHLAVASERERADIALGNPNLEPDAITVRAISYHLGLDPRRERVINRVITRAHEKRDARKLAMEEARERKLAEQQGRLIESPEFDIRKTDRRVRDATHVNQVGARLTRVMRRSDSLQLRLLRQYLNAGDPDIAEAI